MTELDTTTPTKETDAHDAHRPRFLADLPENDRYGDTVVTVDEGNVPLATLAMVYGLLDKMVTNRAHPLELVRPYGSRIEIHAPIRPEQLSDRLAKASEEWDRAADLYDVAKEFGEPSGWSEAELVRSYCRKRHLDRPW